MRREPSAIVVNSASPYRTLDDLLNAARVKPGDLTAAAVYIKCSEHLASMVGMNHPHGHLVTISGSLVPIEHETSTEKLAEVIRQLKADGQAKP